MSRCRVYMASHSIWHAWYAQGPYKLLELLFLPLPHPPPTPSQKNEEKKLARVVHKARHAGEFLVPEAVKKSHTAGRNGAACVAGRTSPLLHIRKTQTRDPLGRLSKRNTFREGMKRALDQRRHDSEPVALFPYFEVHHISENKRMTASSRLWSYQGHNKGYTCRLQ